MLIFRYTTDFSAKIHDFSAFFASFGKYINNIENSGNNRI